MYMEKDFLPACPEGETLAPVESGFQGGEDAFVICCVFNVSGGECKN
jgi:hypothetical protein